jgi:hypothetical protein
MNVVKDVKYLNKDFNQFRKNLIEFTKQYFPNQYTDFNESSPGMIFLELAAYVGDVLSFYTDTNLKESILNQAQERGNIINLANMLGYKPLSSVASHVNLNVFQLIPAKGSGVSNQPNYDFALSIASGMRVKQETGGAEFRTLDIVDFNLSSSLSPTEVTIYEIDPTTNEPVYYLLKKQVQAASGTIKSKNFTFESAKQYDKIVLPDENIIEIISVKESDGDVWTEVPYLAQDTVFEEVLNIKENDPDTYQYRDSSPYLLKMKKVSKRFISRLRSDGKIELQFGAGVSSNNDEEIIPNPSNVGNGIQQLRKNVNVDIDPSNFLYTKAYGEAPANTTLTITYTIGNGISDNIDSNTIKKINFIEFNDDPNSTASQSMMNFVKSSVTINNETPARGGKSKDSLQDIKNNAAANFATQNRLVTKQDYIVRSYSMPSKFGSVAKSYIVPDDQITQNDLEDTRIPNPLAMNLYVLGYNELKQLTTLNVAIKNNLKTYLDYYRILTDAINIKDAFIINFGIDFEITILPNYNSNEVLLNAIDTLQKYFEIDKWQINQPIIKSEVMNTLANTDGVQSVVGLKFNNLYDSNQNYSGNVYDLETATRQGIIYPSLDPSIFELKFPKKDIKGKVTTY